MIPALLAFGETRRPDNVPANAVVVFEVLHLPYPEPPINSIVRLIDDLHVNLQYE